MCSSIKYDPDVWHQRFPPCYTGGEDPCSPNLQANDKMHHWRGGSACELAALWACITICLVHSKKKNVLLSYCSVLDEDEEVKAVSTRWLPRRPQGLHSGDPVCAHCPGIKAAPLLFFFSFFLTKKLIQADWCAVVNSNHVSRLLTGHTAAAGHQQRDVQAKTSDYVDVVFVRGARNLKDRGMKWTFTSVNGLPPPKSTLLNDLNTFKVKAPHQLDEEFGWWLNPPRKHRNTGLKIECFQQF